MSRPRFWFISLKRVPDVYEEDYWPAVKEAVRKGAMWPSYSHVPLKEGRIVFLVWQREGTWQAPVLWMRSRVVSGVLSWKLYGNQFPWSKRSKR